MSCCRQFESCWRGSQWKQALENLTKHASECALRARLRRLPNAVHPRSPLRLHPKLDDDGVDRKADPEGDSEKLAGRHVRQRACGEEHAHYRPGGCDAEQNPDGARRPCSLPHVILAKVKPVGAA